MNSPASERSVVDWDENEVQNWLANIGYPQYETQIRSHRISGDILCMLDAETLKGLGVTTIGQRLAILKAVYLLKMAYNVPIDPDSYIPPSEVQDRSESVSVERLYTMVKDQAHRLRTLEEENKNLNSTLQSFLDDYNTLRQSFVSRSSDDSSPSLRRQTSFKWAQYVKPTKSPTKPEHVESPHPSPHQSDHDIPPYTRSTPPTQPAFNPVTNDKPKEQPAITDSPNLSQAVASKPNRQDSTDNLKSFKVSLEDPTWKVLPAALKKYRINNDNWENYAMFICYGSPGNRIERCLSYDEKPLLLFQKLKDAKKNPVFMLKHIKDIRSPIVVAQQKHAARKASSIMNNGNEQPSGSNSTNAASSTVAGHTKGSSRTITRPPKLEVNDLSAPAPLTSSGVGGLSPQPKWPEPGIVSPLIETQRRAGESVGDDSLLGIPPNSAGTLAPHGSMVSSAGAGANGSTEAGRSRGVTTESPPLSSGREIPVASAGVSYAVAIYPYMAEQEDEFDVVVGDTFIILSRARGWWVVQRDPNGTGLVDTDLAKQGWVPAGCLLETNVPVASAIAEATASKPGSVPSSGLDTPVSKTPILPLSIISTSFPGIALMDYKKKGDEELDLAKDDILRVFKRYNHWSYAVKEDGGDRGWVPSWFIGKVATVPPTPSTSIPPQMSNSMTIEDSNGQPQVSPLSSAFPPVQSRTTTVV
jgi:protein STE50